MRMTHGEKEDPELYRPNPGYRRRREMTELMPLVPRLVRPERVYLPECAEQSEERAKDGQGRFQGPFRTVRGRTGGAVLADSSDVVVVDVIVPLGVIGSGRFGVRRGCAL